MKLLRCGTAMTWAGRSLTSRMTRASRWPETSTAAGSAVSSASFELVECHGDFTLAPPALPAGSSRPTVHDAGPKGNGACAAADCLAATFRGVRENRSPEGRG